MPEGSVITDEMKKAVGVEGQARTHDVEKGHIRLFAEAIGDSNPLFTDEAKARESRFGGIVAPPTFLRSCSSAGVGLNVREVSGLSRALDGGSEWEYFHSIRPGDRITVTSKIAGFEERDTRMGRTLFTRTQTIYRNQLDQVVATQTTTSMLY